MGYSRFLLGVHSANQIMYGFMLGLWTLFVCINYVRPLIVSEVTFAQAVKVLILSVVMLLILVVSALSVPDIPELYQANLLKCDPNFNSEDSKI